MNYPAGTHEKSDRLPVAEERVGRKDPNPGLCGALREGLVNGSRKGEGDVSNHRLQPTSRQQVSEGREDGSPWQTGVYKGQLYCELSR